MLSMAAELKQEVVEKPPAAKGDEDAVRQVKRSVSFCEDIRPNSSPCTLPSGGSKDMEKLAGQTFRAGSRGHPAARSFSASPRGNLNHRAIPGGHEDDTSWLRTSISSSFSGSSLGLQSSSKEDHLRAGILFRHLVDGMTVENAETHSQSGPTGSTLRKHSYTVVGTKSQKASALHPINVSFFLARQEEIAAWTPSDISFKARLDRRQSYAAIGIPVPEVLLQEEKASQKKRPHIDGSLTARGDKNRSRRSRKIEYHTKFMSEKKKDSPTPGPKCFMPKRWDVLGALGSTLDTQFRADPLKLPVIAECLYYSSHGSCRWRPCVVLGFDMKASLYLVFWREKQEDGRQENDMQQETLARLQEDVPDSFSDANKFDAGCSLEPVTSRNQEGGEVAFHRLVPRLNLHFQPQDRPGSPIKDQQRPDSAVSTSVLRGHRPDMSLTTSPDGGETGKVLTRTSHSRQGKSGDSMDTTIPGVTLGHHSFHGVDSRLGIYTIGGPQETDMISRRIVSLAKGSSAIMAATNDMKTWDVNSSPSRVTNESTLGRKFNSAALVYNLFPLLSELAAEFKQLAEIVEPGAIEQGLIAKGPRPVEAPIHKLTDQAMPLAASMAFLRPKLQGGIQSVIDTSLLVERMRIFASECPCVNIESAIRLQSETIRQTSKKLRKKILADAKDALNMAFIEDEGPTVLENGSGLYLQTARWADFLMETALAKALKESLDAYATLFDGGCWQGTLGPNSRQQTVKPLFTVQLRSNENTLTFQPPLSCLDFFSQKLPDDAVKALTLLPFMESKEAVHNKTESLQAYRVSLFAAAVGATATCRLRVGTVLSSGVHRLEQLGKEVSILWTNLCLQKDELELCIRDAATLHHLQGGLKDEDYHAHTQNVLDAISEISKGPDRLDVPLRSQASVCALRMLERLVKSMECLATNKRILQATLEVSDGSVVESVFIFNCAEVLGATLRLGLECKRKVRETLQNLLRCKICQLNEQLDKDLSLLSTPLSDVSPEKFVELELLLQDYKSNCCDLLSDLDVLQGSYSACESLFIELPDADVHAYWSVYGRVQKLLEEAQAKERHLMEAKPSVVAGVRAEQATLLTRASEVVASIPVYEEFKDLASSAEYELQVQLSAEDLRKISGLIQRLQNQEKLLKMFEEGECARLIAPSLDKVNWLAGLWITAAEWERARKNWLSLHFKQINIDNMSALVQAFVEKVENLANPHASSSSKEALAALSDQVNWMFARMPLIVRLHHPGVRRMHWIELANDTGNSYFQETDDETMFSSVIELPLLENRQAIVAVLERAAEEYNQEVCLEKMEEEMRRATLELSLRSKEQGHTIQGTEHVLELLDDQLVAVGSMLHSPYAKALESNIRSWREKLEVLLRMLEGLLNCQKWMQTLRPIFQSPNIQQQLIEESTKFAEVDDTWEEVLSLVATRGLFTYLCESSLITDDVPRCIQTMEAIMCSLVALLEKKRAVFPRFFFLSNDELLQVISHERSPEELQYYLCKCFGDVRHIEFVQNEVEEESIGQAVGMWIRRSEKLVYLNPVSTLDKPVEEWMVATEHEMKEKLKNALLTTVRMSMSSKMFLIHNDPPIVAENFKLSALEPAAVNQLDTVVVPSEPEVVGPVFREEGELNCQVLVIAAYVIFSHRIEMVMSMEEQVKEKLNIELINIEKQLQGLLQKIKFCSNLEEKGTWKSLVIVGVYMRDIVEKLKSDPHVGLKSFAWQRVMRYYCISDGVCQAQVLKIQRPYAFDLVDYQNRLVMTPLTERCFLGLMHTFSLGLGGAISGPAAAGKTETVKDLAKALGKHCIVMSCSDEIDHTAIGNALKGMASGGIWLCLDEFECLRSEVISLLAKQLLIIQQAVHMKAHRFNYDGVGLALNPTFAICTTMKPMYSVRAECTQNVCTLFRPVSMILPDMSMIAQTVLFAEGFNDAAGVARKLTLCFHIAGKQLFFENNHCDFGLRALKAVIKWMGVLRSDPDQWFTVSSGVSKEDLILCKTLQQYCLPRLVGDSSCVFSSLLLDLFPYLQIPPMKQGGLEASIKIGLAQSSLCPHEPLVQKCLQLHGTMKVHQGVMIVGGSGTGKTQCYASLARAFNIMADAQSYQDAGLLIKAQVKRDDKYRPLVKHVNVEIVNPTAVSTAHLFGSVNAKSHCWQEGIVPHIVRKCEASARYDAALWMVLDGSMNGQWVDSINTMLDDTGVLFLRNGERIFLPSIESFSVIFEVDTLRGVSPAAVSRCGIVLMDPTEPGWRPLVSSWLQRHLTGSPLQSYIEQLFESFLPLCLKFNSGNPLLPMSDVGLVQSLLHVLEGTLKGAGRAYRFADGMSILEISGGQKDSKHDAESNSRVETGNKGAVGRLEKSCCRSKPQKQVRDVVNWRRLYHESSWFPTENISMERDMDENVDRTGHEEYSTKDLVLEVQALPISLETLHSAKTSVGSLFIFSLVWSVGGLLADPESRGRFDKCLRDCSSTYTDFFDLLPEGSIYEFYFDVRARIWKSWKHLLLDTVSQIGAGIRLLSKPNDLVRNGSHLSLSLQEGALFIPTQETVRYEMLASCFSELARPVLLSGVPGCGKTTVASYLLYQLKAVNKYQVVGVTLHETSGGSALFNVLRPKLAIQKRRILTPAIHEKMAFFIDDLNVAHDTTQGDAPTQQFIRFLIEQQGWYGFPADAVFTTVRGLVHFAAISINGIPPGLAVARLLRHYFVIHFHEYSNSSLASIFCAALGNRYYELGHSIVTGLLLNQISEASTKLFCQLKAASQSLTDRFSLSLHDIFRVLRRLLSASLGRFTEKDGIFRVWANEFCRAICDGLTVPADRFMLISALSAVAKERLIPETDDQLPFLESLVSEQIQPIFGNYYRVVQPDGVMQAWSQYEEVSDRKTWTESMQKFLMSYCMEEGYKNSLVLFPEAVTHLTRVLRMLQLPDGHALLLGCSGSGRSSMTRLATHILGYVLCEVQVNSDYDYQTWRVTLRQLLKSASLRDTHSVLLLKMEIDIDLQRRIVQDLNQIIHCGEAWELLGDEERYYIQQELHRLEDTTMVPSFELEIGSDREQFLKLRFLHRLKEKLHLVICAGNSSRSETLRSSFYASSLIASHFSTDYYDRWTLEALQAVAKVKLTEHELVKALPDSRIQHLVRCCSEVHDIINVLASESSLDKSSSFIRQGYLWQKGSWRLVGLASYHEMLYVFGTILEKKGGEVDSLLDRLETGVKKLKSTRNLVFQMQRDLQEILNCKEHTSSDMDQLLFSIHDEQIAMDKALQAVYDEEKLAVEEAELCRRLAQAAQEQVEEVAPQVSAAIKQLSLLNKKDVSELKSFTQPPPRLLIVLEALCIILGKKPRHRRLSLPHDKDEVMDDYWPAARELLSQVNFVQLLLNFNKDGMERATMEKLRPYMENPLFKPEKVRRISVACRSICIWIRAMYKYHVAKTIKMEPRLEKLKVANENLEKCKVKLEEKRLNLATTEESLFHLKARYENASLTKGCLVRKAEDSELKLQRAIRLITRLDGECHRWAEQVDDLKLRRENLLGDTLLAAGYVSYLGAFPASVRSAIVTKWQNSFRRIELPYSLDFSLVTFCSAPQDIKTWVAAGLPPDTHSLENAIIVCNSSRPALILDPQKQVSSWICSLADPYGVQMVDANSEKLIEEIEFCILADGLLLVENVGSSTPPGLLHRITTLRKVKSSNGMHIGPSRQHCKQSSNCRCIFLTSETGFNCSDEAGISLNIVDFSITFHGLCSQLLSIAAERERQDLEEERNRLLHLRLLLNCRLQEVENHILTLLQGAMGSILDNEALEQALSVATVTYADIQARMKKAASTENTIEAIRRRYMPIAERATIMYSCIADVAKLESVYQWTLPWFKVAYSKSMERTSSLNPVELETRLTYLISKVTTAIYKRVSSSLLRRHRLLFGLLVAFRIAQTRQDVNQEEWMFLLRGEIGAPTTCCEKKCPSWLKTHSTEWRQLCHLSKLPSFEGVVEDLKGEPWKDFYLSTQCVSIPASWRRRLGTFRSLLVLRCLRPDRLPEAIQGLVREVLDLGFEDETLLTVEDAYQESNPNIPITCIHQDVSAPIEEIFSFAKHHSMLRKLWVFSLDHCQESKVVDAIKEAAQWGKWVLLRNCHTDPFFMRRLESVFEDLRQNTVQSSFRLWLTTKPLEGYPSSLLTNCVRIVLEPPKGMKSKVLKFLLAQQADEDYSGQRKMRKEGRNVQHSRSIFQLALFHSLVQERGSFGYLGWNNALPIDVSDFNLAKAQLEELREDSSLPGSGQGCSPEGASTENADIRGLWNQEFSESENVTSENLWKMMVTQIIYGGYVVDSWDQHCLTKLYDRCFAKLDEYENWEAVMRTYLPKNSGTLEDFINHTQQLPDVDDPEVMGLPKDAVIGRAQREAQELLSMALSLECHENCFIETFTCMFEFDDKKGMVLKCLQDIGNTVSCDLPVAELRSQLWKCEDPLLMILLQEVKHYNRLIQIVRDSIIQVQKAILHPEERNSSIEAICSSILAGQVPDLWLSYSYPTLKPLTSWVDDLLKRLDFVKGWIDFGTPKVIWISGLFFPQAVFAAIVQQYARVHLVPLDSIYLHVGLVDYESQMEYPSDGYYITGLFLEGAKWDSKQRCLAEADSTHLLTKMCEIWLRPSSSPFPSWKCDDQSFYSCPIYRNQARNGKRQSLESCVGTVDLPAGKLQSKFWVLRGVALICNTRD